MLVTADEKGASRPIRILVADDSRYAREFTRPATLKDRPDACSERGYRATPIECAPSARLACSALHSPEEAAGKRQFNPLELRLNQARNHRANKILVKVSLRRADIFVLLSGIYGR